jgi:hypothetical protein
VPTKPTKVPEKVPGKGARKSNRPQKGVERSALRVAYLVDPADAMVACLIAGASVAVSAAA